MSNLNDGWRSAWLLARGEIRWELDDRVEDFHVWFATQGDHQVGQIELGEPGGEYRWKASRGDGGIGIIGQAATLEGAQAALAAAALTLWIAENGNDALN